MTLKYALKLSLAYKLVFKHYIHKHIEQNFVGTSNYEFGDIITGYLSNDNDVKKIETIILEWNLIHSSNHDRIQNAGWW